MRFVQVNVPAFKKGTFIALPVIRKAAARRFLIAGNGI